MGLAVNHSRIYLFRPNNHILREPNVQSKTDETAKSVATAILRDGFAVEVWEDARYVFQLPIDRPAPASPQGHCSPELN